MSYNPKELKSGFNNIDTEVNYTFVGRDPITNKERLKRVSLKPGIDFNSIEEKYEKVIEIDKQSLIEQLEPAFNDVFVSEELEKYNNDSKFRKKVEEYLNGLKTGKFNNRDFIGMLNDEREKATNIIENKSLDKLLDFLMALTSNRVRDSKMPTLKKERGKTVFEDATEITLYDKKELISKKYLRYVLKEGNISYLDTLKMDSNLFDKQYAIEMVLRSLTYIHPYVDHILENDAEYGTMKNQLLFRIRKLIGKNKLLPEVSPNKTWEGTIGGSLVGTFVCTVYYLTVINPNESIFKVSIVVMFLTLVGQFGDLFFSAIKRKFEIKELERF